MFIKKDVTHTMVGKISDLSRPEITDGVYSRELSVAELRELAENPQYDLTTSAIDGVEQNSNRHCFATFKDGEVSAYMFFATNLIKPEMNTAGIGYGGIGMNLPNDVLYIHKGFALPKFRGQRQVNIATIAGADALVDKSGWMVSTVEIANHASIKMLQNVGLHKQDLFREYRVFGKAKYIVPSAIQLGPNNANSSKTVAIFTPE